MKARKSDKGMDATPNFMQTGLRFQRQGKLKKALRSFVMAFFRGIHRAGALNNMGVVFRKSGLPEKAVAAYFLSLRNDPDNPGTLSNLGNSLQDAGRHDEALIFHQKATQLGPQVPAYFHHLGICFMDLGRNSEAIKAFKKAIELEPEFVEANWDLSLALLQSRQFEAGWPLYEYRWKLLKTSKLPVEGRQWDGNNLPDGTLLVIHEQGFGDTLMAVRFLSQIRPCVKKLILICQPELISLLQDQVPADLILPTGTKWPLCDAWIPLMSIPWLLRIEAATISSKPYLRAPFHLTESADFSAIELLDSENQAAGKTGGLKIGVIWSGSTTFSHNHIRACRFKYFLRLLEVPDVTLFSLQKDQPSRALDQPGMRVFVNPLGEKLDNFATTAAVMEELDLIIMTDSAVAHLAGAMGKPVWVLLAYRHDWRWFEGAGISPWYEKMRLFKQKRPGDWDGVFEEVVAALKEFQPDKN